MSDPSEINRRNMGNVELQSLEKLAGKDKEVLLDQVEKVERSAWPDELEAPREKFLSRLEIFPEGFIIAKVDGIVRGMSTSEIVDYDPEKKSNWNELTDNGFIKTTHDPLGNSLYVVSVAVAGDAQGLGLGSKLVDAQKALAKKLSKKYLLLGARTPGYAEYCKNNGEISIEDYLDLKNEKGESVDPEIRFYERRGLKRTKIVPDFEPDPDSKDYGVVMLWENS
jgi:ribosomal protein S18 acetylase RimI-like enzyme